MSDAFLSFLSLDETLNSSALLYYTVCLCQAFGSRLLSPNRDLLPSLA